MGVIENKQVLKGSVKAGPADFSTLPPIAREEVFSVTLRLRRKSELPAWNTLRITRHQHSRRHGALTADLAAIESFASAYDLRVSRASVGRREVVLKGTASAMQKAFGVELRLKEFGRELRRVREGEIKLPKSIAALVTSVTGLDNRPFAKPHFRISPHATNGSSLGVGFTPLEVAALYNFPGQLDGSGQSIAIVELGGGFRPEELDAYFQGLGIKAPAVSVVSFPGCGGNNPGFNARDPFCRDAEVMLDLQVAGGAAPGAKLLVYFAEDDSDQSFLGVFSAIVHDTVNKPAIVSISWGVPESTTTQQFRDEFDQLLQSAAHMGVTVCAATGDNAAADFAADDPEWDKGAHVDFPASSPWTLACGGTRVSTANNELAKEDLWFEGPNDGAGGGISRFFGVPDFQSELKLPRAVQPDGPPMRGVPDVSANAAPATGYQILCNNQKFPDPANQVAAMGGTSAVAPLYAALVARLNQALPQPCGHMNPKLYALAMKEGQDIFRVIPEGTNGAYTASTGWNACAGLGSVDGTKLLNALKSQG